MKKMKSLAIAGVMTASIAATAFAAEVNVSGEIRVRDVITNNYDFSDDAGDRSNVVSQRTRVNVDAKLDETTKAFISLQDTRIWGNEAADSNGNGVIDANEQTATTGNDVQAVDISQAYVQLDQLFAAPLSLKLGRQVLAYGEHRIIGSFEWSDNARRFDALKLTYNQDAFAVDFWIAKLLELNGTPGGANEEDGYLNGIYATIKSIPANTLDVYAIQKQEIDQDDQSFITYGARLDGKAMNIDWTVEAAMQSGEQNQDVDQSASMIALKGGYTAAEVAGGLRIGAELVTASGQDATETDSEVWDDMYPTNHPLYGVSDHASTKLSGVNNSGLTAYSLNIGAKPMEGLKLLAEYWVFQATEDDATGGEEDLGSEFNVQAWYAVRPNVNLHGYYARFMPEDGLTGGGAADDDEADNFTLQMEVKF